MSTLAQISERYLETEDPGEQALIFGMVVGRLSIVEARLSELVNAAITLEPLATIKPGQRYGSELAYVVGTARYCLNEIISKPLTISEDEVEIEGVQSIRVEGIDMPVTKATQKVIEDEE